MPWGAVLPHSAGNRAEIEHRRTPFWKIVRLISPPDSSNRAPTTAPTAVTSSTGRQPETLPNSRPPKCAFDRPPPTKNALAISAPSSGSRPQVACNAARAWTAEAAATEASSGTWLPSSSAAPAAAAVEAEAAKAGAVDEAEGVGPEQGNGHANPIANAFVVFWSATSKTSTSKYRRNATADRNIAMSSPNRGTGAAVMAKA
mmetsp:Transcript_71853/g.232723  ORF Transcript_71853/g.232723 Transcript_71853/m.232723 type:complete len:202 (-) Transcript_71853:1336-1941(-)